MSVYDLYQSYLNQQVSPVMESPVDPNYLLYLQQLQQQQGGGGDNQYTNIPTYDPNIGKNFYDYEADAYNVGPTFAGGIVTLIDKFKSLPTPMNLLMKGLQGIGTLASNIRDPYKTFTGDLKPEVQEAIQRDTVREMARENERSGGGGYQAGYDGGFMGGSGTSSEMGSF